MADASSGEHEPELPPHLELQRTRVVCAPDAPSYTESVQYSGAYMAYGVDNSLRIEDFCKNLRVEIISMNEEDIEFDIVGIDAAIANAFRRILIAEVPTMAIEKVYIANNTSVIQDEVLAHRLGLLPIKADPRLFDYKSEEENANEKNTIVFKIDVVCTRKGERVLNSSVTSDQMKWLPEGSEMPFNTMTKFTSFGSSQKNLPGLPAEGISCQYPDIIVAKLRPGQAIELEGHAIKGSGNIHAKWSPVATARYRMLPEVNLMEDIQGKLAEELVQKCPTGVFDIEDVGTDSVNCLLQSRRPLWQDQGTARCVASV
uniref:DNA-directed RNA polymerase RpoA/D/Rpb3-type domain-containing protein n=2 Tax=Physcomitrium patens TaxID=3218 RepID=A0A7I4E3F9_PHYPA